MRCWIILCVVLLAVLGGVSAACDSSQVIFKISNVYNAHGELWNQNNYDTEICFDDYFNEAYIGEGEHDCDDSNAVLGLSTDTNAHAEFDGDYSEEVCYGDLSCQLISSGNCNDKGSFIVSLSDTTNAHIALGDFYNCDTHARYICCSSDSQSPICNYDGECDSDDGETSQNCPTDCLLVRPNSCFDGKWYDWNLVGHRTDDISSTGWCNKMKDFEENGIECCPAGEYTCIDNGAGYFCEGYGCPGSYELTYEDNNIIGLCEEINYYADEDKKQFLCQGCSDEIAANEGDGDCAWIDNWCYFTKDDGNCVKKYLSIDECAGDDVYRKLTYTWIGTGCEDCGEGCETELLCPQKLKLGFFGIFGFALSVSLIILIYLFRTRWKWRS